MTITVENLCFDDVAFRFSDSDLKVMVKIISLMQSNSILANSYKNDIEFTVKLSGCFPIELDYITGLSRLNFDDYSISDVKISG